VQGVFEKENLYSQEFCLILLISLHLNISQSNYLLYGLLPLHFINLLSLVSMLSFSRVFYNGA
jgi:hypothetical protein